jgi:TolB-like protein
LRKIRASVVEPKIAEHAGRIFNTAGDGILVEFGSATAALRCAVEIQREMGHRNLYVSPESRIEFRIGVNLGDIIDDGAEIAGDGINVASRLEALAEPGGICVASNVYDQIHDDLGFGFLDIGEQHVKNIARPVHAYRVRLAAGAMKESHTPAVARNRRWWLAGGAVAAAVIVAAGALVLIGGTDWFKTGPAARADSVAAPSMSIAVLPFNVAGGGIDKSLGQRLTQDLTAALSRAARYALVASHGSVASQKGKQNDARTVGRELNVRYLAEGDLRQDGDKIVVDTRMIDAETARQVWSDRLSTTSAQLEANADAVVGVLANRIRATLFNTEMSRVSQQSGGKANAADLWLRGVATEDDTLKGAREALKLYDEALRLDPKFVGALVSRTWNSELLIELDPGADRERLIGEMEEFSRRAVVADRSDPRAWLARSEALARQYRWNEALEALDETLRIDPNRFGAYKGRAQFMIWMGRPQDALAELDKVVALDAREADDGETMRLRCRASLALGRYDDAIKLCERSAALLNSWTTYAYLAAAYAHAGKTTQAAAAQAELLKLQPGYTIGRLRALRISNAPEYWQQVESHFIEGLRKAGVPEQ